MHYLVQVAVFGDDEDEPFWHYHKQEVVPNAGDAPDNLVTIAAKLFAAINEARTSIGEQIAVTTPLVNGEDG